MVFERKPKPSLLDAIFLVNDASAVANEYSRDRQYLPSEKDLCLLNVLVEALLRNHAMVAQITRDLHRRARGEPEGTNRRAQDKPEGAKQLTGPKVLDFPNSRRPTHDRGRSPP